MTLEGLDSFLYPLARLHAAINQLAAFCTLFIEDLISQLNCLPLHLTPVLVLGSGSKCIRGLLVPQLVGTCCPSPPSTRRPSPLSTPTKPLACSFDLAALSLHQPWDCSKGWFPIPCSWTSVLGPLLPLLSHTMLPFPLPKSVLLQLPA